MAPHLRPHHRITHPRNLHPGAWWLWALGLAAAASRTTNPVLLRADPRGRRVRRRRAPDATRRGPRVRRLPAARRWSSSRSGWCSQALLSARRRQGIDGAVHAARGPAARLGGRACSSAARSPWRRCSSAFVRRAAAGRDPLLHRRRQRAGQRRAAAALRARRALRGRRRRRGRADLRAAAGRPTPGGCARPARLRGRDRTRTARRCAASAMPVLEGALERSVDLAAAMDSRGYGRTAARTRGAPAAHRRRSSLVGLLGVCARPLRPARRDAADAARAAAAASVGLAAGGRRAGARRPAHRRAPATGPTRGRCPEWLSSPAARLAAVLTFWQAARRPDAAGAVGRRRWSCRRCPSLPALGLAGRRCCPPWLRRRRRRVEPSTATLRSRHPRTGRGGRVIRFDRVERHATPAPPRRCCAASTCTSPRASWCLVVGRTGSGKSTLLRAVNGLVPHFTGGTLAGRVDRRRPRHPRPPAARPRRRRRLRRAGPAGRLRHRHRRGGARLRHGVARRCRPT